MVNIFVLEDNSKRIKWFKKTFNLCRVIYTSNVSKAIDILSKNQFDIIFLDHDLDSDNLKETGRELSRQMKKKKLALRTPVILHTKNPHGRRKMVRHLQKYKDKKDIYLIIFSKLRKYSAEMIYSMVEISRTVKKSVKVKKKNKK